MNDPATERQLADFYRENARLMTQIQLAAQEYRAQHYHSAGLRVPKIVNGLQRLASTPYNLPLQNLQVSCMHMVEAMERKDYVLCADVLSAMLQDMMIPIQQAIHSAVSDYLDHISQEIHQLSGGDGDLEETLYGYPTFLSHTCGERYLCSNEDPMVEGYALAEEAFDPAAKAYSIWGMGLGYHIAALWEKTGGACRITVYDTEPYLFDLAMRGDLGPWQKVFTEGNIEFVADPDMTRFMNSLSQEKTKGFLHMPSVLKLPEHTQTEKARKEVLLKLQIRLSSYDQMRDHLLLNFYRNLENVHHFAAELFPCFAGRDVVLVAAGPSLDKNIGLLKEALDRGEDLAVMAVGTVFRKLILAGILPDAVCFLDAQARTYGQLEGLEDQPVPMILDSTAYYKFAASYQGPKYLALQADFEPAERLSKEQADGRLFATGGSVTTLALDFIIQACPERVILMGCDLAYTGGASHAEGTMDRHTTNREVTVTVKAYDGGEVETNLLFQMYREWMEKRICREDAKNTTFVNATEGGAYIQGMEHKSFAELMK